MTLERVRCVLLDIEGTTTPIAFVHDTLFPFARVRLADWFERHVDTPDGDAIISALAQEHRVEHASPNLPVWRTDTALDQRASVVGYAEWLMDGDRKSPGLKLLQGLIWEEGYQAGQLRGEVYDDVPRALQRWSGFGLRTAIYSSGSELAQRRLFQSTECGDLTPLIAGFFDTRVGAKVEVESYRRIAAALACSSDEVLFVSDLTRELDAARAAGCRTRLSVRPGNRIQPEARGFEAVFSLDEILPVGS